MLQIFLGGSHPLEYPIKRFLIKQGKEYMNFNHTLQHILSTLVIMPYTGEALPNFISDIRYLLSYSRYQCFKNKYPNRIYNDPYLPIEWACSIKYSAPADKPEKMFYIK